MNSIHGGSNNYDSSQNVNPERTPEKLMSEAQDFFSEMIVGQMGSEQFKTDYIDKGIFLPLSSGNASDNEKEIIYRNLKKNEAALAQRKENEAALAQIEQQYTEEQFKTILSDLHTEGQESRDAQKIKEDEAKLSELLSRRRIDKGLAEAAKNRDGARIPSKSDEDEVTNKTNVDHSPSVAEKRSAKIEKRKRSFLSE